MTTGDRPLKGSPLSREETKQQTRSALLAAGVAEIAEKGLDTPSLDDICARAGYTRGAFYVHFKDREDFVVQLMNSLLVDFINELLAADADHPDLPGVIRRYAEALGAGLMPTEMSGVRLSQLLEAGARFPAVRSRGVAMVREIWARLEKRVQVAQAEEVVRSDVDADVLSMLLLAIAVGGMTIKEIGLELDLERFEAGALRMLAG